MNAQKERITRGARLLDRVRPGWFRRVKITKLDMAQGERQPDGCGCILAQVYGNFVEASQMLGLDLRTYSDSSHGFNYGDGDDSFDDLGEAWKDEIRKRRAA